MTIRLLADREPYTSYAEESCSEGEGSYPDALVLVNGPSALDDPDPDVLVLPADTFFLLREAQCHGERSPSAPGARIAFIPYGPVSSMEKAFALGCADYLRDPWSLPELRARSRRFLKRRFSTDSASFVFESRELRSGKSAVMLTEDEAAIFRMLLANTAALVPKAALASIFGRSTKETTALDYRVASIRRKMSTLAPQFGAKLVTVKNYGYRLDVSNCG